METKLLKDYLNILKHGTTYRTIQPILANVLITPEKLMTTDLDLTVEVFTDTGFKSELTAPYKRIEQFVKPSKSNSINFTSIDDNLTLKINSGEMSTELRALPAEEFPLNKMEGEYKHLDLETEHVESITKLLSFAATYETNNVLGGINLQTRNGKLHIATTDGSRLGREIFNISCEGDFNLTIHHNIQKVFRDILKNFKIESIDLEYSKDKQPRFIFNLGIGDRIVITGRILEGQYPLYNQLIPIENQHKLSLDRKKLLQALTQLKPFTNERTNCFTFNCFNNELSASASIPDVGSTSIEIDHFHSSHWDLSNISFNIAFVIDALKSFDDDTIHIETNGMLSPTIITSTGNSEQGYTHLVMPIQRK